MAPTISTNQPIRSSTRLRKRKEAAEKAAAAAAVAMATESQAATAVINTTTKKTREGKDNRNRNRNRKAVRAQITKHTTAHAKKTRMTHHRYFLTREQLSTIIDQHRAEGNLQSWVSGDFCAAGPGEEVPTGSLELSIKVPKGLRFLRFPEVLNLVEVKEMEERGSGMMEEDEHVGESSDSELSECGYISDVHV
jgi:hypothetical protein